MKWLRLFLFALLICGFSAPPPAGDEILWHKRHDLTWKDFKPTRDNKSRYKALTHTGIRSNTGFVGAKLEVTVDCYFVKSKSWVRKGHQTDLLLAHEQGHFNITEIFARQLRQRYEKLGLTRDNFNQKRDPKRLQEIYQDIYENMEAFQDQYDEETNHGILEDQQTAWNEKIAAELQDLEAFAR